jgi:hypothetical protein
MKPLCNPYDWLAFRGETFVTDLVKALYDPAQARH